MKDWETSPQIAFSSLVNQVIGVIIGGSDTTRAAYAMVVPLLLEDGDAWEAATWDPALIPGAVAEALRFELSVGSTVRFTTGPVPIGDVVVPAGAIVLISTISAMRDPHLYRDPERSRTGRRDAEPEHGPAPAAERHRRHPPDYTDGGAYRMTRTAPGGAGPGTTRGTAIAAPDPRCVSRRDAERHG